MTPDLQDVLRTAAEANRRVNDVLCTHLTPGMMRATTPGGGLTVAQHLAHMAGVTKFWLSELDGEAAAPLPVLYDTSREDVFLAQEDPARAAEVLRELHSAALQTVLQAGDRGQLSHPTPAQFLLHMHTHDAHHRGQILLALKTAGFTLPDEDAMWGPLRGE